MIIVIDESGEISVRSMRRYFILGLIKIENNKSAERIVGNINDFALRINHKSEFKFSKTNHKNRVNFLDSVKNCDFKFRCIVVDKNKITQGFLKKNPKEAYDFFLKQLLEDSNINYDSSIYIDGTLSKEMKAKLNSYLKNCGIKYKKLEFIDSKKSRFIQLADMFVSSVGSKYNKNDSTYFDLIKNKIESEWIF